MNQLQTFVSRPPVVHQDPFPLTKHLSTQDLLDEVSLYSCSPQAVEGMGGTLVRRALNAIRDRYEFPIRSAQDAGLSAICDVRIHRLFAGQFPCIPGWHCDFVPRGTYSGQPNFSMVHPKAFHVCLLLSDSQHGVSNTQFIDQAVHVKIWDQEHVYKNVHEEIERFETLNGLRKLNLPDGKFCWFNSLGIHRGMPATRRGVRMFMRYSMIEKPVILNQVAKQLQIYQLSEKNGW